MINCEKHLLSIHRLPLVFLWCLFLLNLPTVAVAQFQFEFVTEVPVQIAGDSLRNPWAGGLNAGQYSTIDLNRDGQPDLAVFDRTSGKLNTFISQAGEYVYAPRYEALFPADLRNWMLLVDYNCDGKQDIFTSSSGGVRVFENISDDQLRFQLSADPVMTVGSASPVNLQVNATDIPGIVDVDNDGDLDILTFNFASGGMIEYHQNQSVEVYGTCDSLRFERVTQRWGEFEECNCGVYAFGEQGCDAINGRVQHVGGKSILALDADGDGDQDLVFGDETCTSLAFLINEGNANRALFTAASDTFPVATDPTQGFFFPAAYQLGAESPSVVVAPNVFSNLQQSIDLTQSSWLYRRSDEATGGYELVQRDFLQDEMIDLGAFAAPAFGDYDGDGDIDLLLGAERTSSQARLELYENVGTPRTPSFRRVEEDYLNLSSEAFSTIKPLLADVNGDGNADLVLQATRTALLSDLYYIPNQSDAGWNFTGGLQLLPDAPSLITADTPFLTDVDQDGKVDVLIGRLSGRLEYWHNQGDEVPVFALETDSLAGIKNNPFRRSPSPWVGDLDGDGSRELLVTDATGVMQIYENFLNDTPTAITRLLRSGEGVRESRWGVRAWWSGADLFGTGRLALAVGHAQGGVYLLASVGDAPPPNGGEGEPLDLTVYPNPTLPNEPTTVVVNRPARLVVYDMLGRMVLEENRILPGTEYQFGAVSLPDGVYLFKAVADDGQTATQRLIVQS